MKKNLLILVLFLVTASVSLAQVPAAINYQAVARDASGNALVNKSISLRMSVLAGGTVLYTETFSAETNGQGMFTLNLGKGTPTLGNFQTIDWVTGNEKTLKVEMDANGGTNYTDLGLTAFTSVPYALVANSVDGMSINDLDDVNALAPTTNQVLQWNGTIWTPATLSPASTLVTSSSLSGAGTTASPLTVAQQNATSGQVLQWNGTAWNPATISGGVGDNWGTQFVQKNVTLDGNGTNASPLKIAQQGAVTGETLLWNGSLWTPGRPVISVDGVFTGQGTPTLPLKLGQQNAAIGDALKWNGTTWIPGAPFSLPYLANGATSGSFVSLFSIMNLATNGAAIAAEANGGIGLDATSNPATGKAVSGKSQDGIGIYGSAGANGLAGMFDGTVAVLGQLKVYGAQVLSSGDVYLADQPNSILSAPVSAVTTVPGFEAVTFTVRDNSNVSTTTPARVIVKINCPNYFAPSADANVRFNVSIKKGTNVIAGYDFYTSLTQNIASSVDFSRHFKLTEAGEYTAILQINPSGSSVSASYFQMQLQVIHP
jgi:hypothetical protein